MRSIELLNSVVNSKIANMHICMPATIVEYNFENQKAKVQPDINQKYTDDTVVPFPVIHSVPVVQPFSGGASIKFPVNIGDKVLLLFSEKSLEEWLSEGNQTTPDDSRTNSLTDAIALLGLRPFSDQFNHSNNSDWEFSYEGAKMKFKKGGKIDIDATEANITAGTVNIEGNMNINGNLTVSGDITGENVTASTSVTTQSATIGGTNFATHMHPGVTPGGGTTGPPI